MVQFIGACTRKPNLCIVFEYMSGGSVYDWIRREGPLKLSTVLKVCVEVSRGMDYLHQRNIIHRDLKAANLLLDENGTVRRVCRLAGIQLRHRDGAAVRWWHGVLQPLTRLL